MRYLSMALRLETQQNLSRGPTCRSPAVAPMKEVKGDRLHMSGGSTSVSGFQPNETSSYEMSSPGDFTLFFISEMVSFGFPHLFCNRLWDSSYIPAGPKPNFILVL